MQNEAILSLTILTKICPAESEELLIEADFGRNMREFFEACSNNLDIHIILNALSLLNSVVQSGILVRLYLMSNVILLSFQEHIYE